MGILVLAVASACQSGGGRLDALAQQTCEALDGQMMLLVGVILEDAISEAQAMGHSAPELGEAMREQCPSIMRQLDEFSDEQTESETRQTDLESGVELDLERCKSDGAEGTVRNRNNVAVNVTIEVQFLDDDGVLLDTGLDFVTGVRPGQTARWDAFYFGDRYDRCLAEVTSVYES